MRDGALHYCDIRRYAIVYADGADAGESCELHCGDCFQVKYNDKWTSARIEYTHNPNGINHGWCFIGEF